MKVGGCLYVAGHSERGIVELEAVSQNVCFNISMV